MLIHPLITDTASLHSLCERLAHSPFVAVDTEFMRENTYWPDLCLIQIGDQNEAAAIDPTLEIREPVFRIRVRIDEVAPGVSEAETRLRAGMTLTAHLVLQRRSLWEVIFNPFASALRT